MEIDLSDISRLYRKAHEVRYSRHEVHDRLKPNILQYDYLSLRMLVTDVKKLLTEVPSPVGNDPGIAIDIGCGKSPYREIIEARGFVVKTMDIDGNDSPDYVGTIENTGLPDGSADLVICTQVLEHSLNPGRGLQEIYRILGVCRHAAIRPTCSLNRVNHPFLLQIVSTDLVGSARHNLLGGKDAMPV